MIRGEVPEEMESFAPETENGQIGLVQLIAQAGLAASNGEARRLIQGGGVKIDGEKVTDVAHTVDVGAQAPFVLRAGKRRYVRVVQG